jgi:autotransporter-associated beta strand protein
MFTNEGAGTVTIINGGVVIDSQDSEYGTGMIVYNSDDNDYTFTGGSISGDGGLYKQGNGKLTFTQENTFTGRTIIDAGTVIAQKSSSLGSGDIVLRSSDATLEFNLNGQGGGELEQQITGSGKLVKSGMGSLTLKSQGNSYSGGTTVLGGTLIADGVQAIGLGEIVTGSGSDSGTVIFNMIKDGIFSETISGTGSIQTAGNNELTLSRENSYSGGTIIGAGSTLRATNIFALGTNSSETEISNVQNNGTLIFELASGGTFNQTISGSGTLEKTGGGLLELEQANTFSGTTTLFAGTLSLKNELALQNSLFDYQGGRLELGTLKKVQLGGLSGTQNLSLNNIDNKPIALTIGTSNENSTFSGNITGSGSVTKIGSGTQMFSGKNTYSGGTLISAGRLVSVGASGFGSANVMNNSEMEFQILEDKTETYKNFIAGSGSLWKSGNGTLKLTGINTYQGGTIIQDGQISVTKLGSLSTGDILLGSNTSSLYLDFADDETLSQRISGSGSVFKAGAGKLVFDQDLNTTGDLNVLGGAVFLNSATKAKTTVSSGATLGGRGWIENDVTFLDGSSHRVGKEDDAGLVKFTAKNIAYENNSTVYIKIGMNGNDQVVANEGINFAQGGGDVNVVLINFSLYDFDPETTTSPKEYEIFVAQNGRLLLDGERIDSGKSDSDILTVDEADEAAIHFLAAPDEGLEVLGYEVKVNEEQGRSLSLNLALTGPGALAYLNGEQQTMLRSIGDADVFDGIFSCNRDYRGAVLEQMMPMIQTAMPFITERSITQFNLASFERLRFLREPLVLTDQEIEAYRGSSSRFAHIHARTNYLWFQNYGDFIRLSAHNSTPEFQADSYGYSFGLDRGINYHTSIGIGMGGYISNIKANEVYQEGDINSFLLSMYGNWVNDDNWMMTGSLGFVFSSYELQRRVPIFDTTLKSKHGGTTSFASLEGSKKLQFGKFEVSPYLGADFIWLGESGYTEDVEKGLSSLALKVNSHDTFTILSSAGVRLGRSMRMLGGNIVTPTLYAAWIHDWTQSDISSTASFVGEPTFKIHGASMNRDRVQLGTNINMTLNKRTDMFARFNSELASHYSNLSFHWGIRFGY